LPVALRARKRGAMLRRRRLAVTFWQFLNQWWNLPYPFMVVGAGAQRKGARPRATRAARPAL